MKRWDLLVLGGGPAGAAAAAACAAAGARVLVVERSRFPRDKVCGEFLSAEARPLLRELGVLDALHAAGAVAIDRCRVSEPAGRTLAAALPDLDGDRAGMGISRARLDSLLLDLARRRGATVREEVEATSPLLREGRVVGARLRPVGGERTEEVRASVVLAADGRRSMLVRHLHPRRGDPTVSGPDSWFGLKTHRRGGGRSLAGSVDLHVFDGGYTGLAAVEEGRINVCLLATVGALRACGGRPERLLAERVCRNPAARASLEGTAPAGRWHSIGPLRFGPRLPAASGSLFLGDAAGTIDPFSGEGMVHALRAARLAAPIALQAAAEGALGEALAARYTHAWQEAFGASTARARRLARLLERPLAATAAVVLLRTLGPQTFARLVAHSRTGLGTAP